MMFVVVVVLCAVACILPIRESEIPFSGRVALASTSIAAMALTTCPSVTLAAAAVAAVNLMGLRPIAQPGLAALDLPTNR